MRVLMMLIPDDEAAVPPSRPVLRMEHFVEPYYLFRDAAVEVVLASPAGGFPAMGLASEDPEPLPEAMHRFRADRIAREELNDTLSLDQIYPDDFDAALCIGSPGRIWHQNDGSQAGAVIAAFLAAGKPVGVIPSVLDLAPHGTGEGLLIVGDGAGTPLLAAQALLGVLRGQTLPSEGTEL